MLLYQILAYTVHRKVSKSHTKTITLKYQIPCGEKNFIYLFDHILYQKFKTILNVS